MPVSRPTEENDLLLHDQVTPCQGCRNSSRSCDHLGAEWKLFKLKSEGECVIRKHQWALLPQANGRPGQPLSN